MKALSIIIVSYNTKNYLQQCLSSIYAQIHTFSFEVIVVDNHSTDGTADMVKTDYPQVVLVTNSQNLGFSKANNIGLFAANGAKILFLNSDTKIIDNVLHDMVEFLNHHNDVAAVSPRLVYPDYTDQGVARMFPTPMNALFGRKTLLTRLFPNNRFSKRYLKSLKEKTNIPFEVDWVSGACLMVRREVLDNVGSFDEDFFMYWEDLELCYRIKQADWKVYCVSTGNVIHYEGKSTTYKENSRCIIEFNRGAYRYYRKHHAPSLAGVMNVAAVLFLAFRTLVLLAINQFKANET